MENQIKIMVINNIFDEENLLIVKSRGSQMVSRYDNTITNEDLHAYLKKNDIDINSCVINVVEEDWKGNPKISRY